jgi:hypothetical protein
MNTEYIDLTEMWHNGEYADVARIINEESWSSSEVANFCAYFAKYIGLKELDVLNKFL